MAPLGGAYQLRREDAVSFKLPGGRRGIRLGDVRSRVSAWLLDHPMAGTGAHALALGVLLPLYCLGQLYYFTPAFHERTETAITDWSGHAELVRPIYFGLVAGLPVLLSILLVEVLRHYNVRRVASRYLLRLAMILRRKPRSLGGGISHWSYGEWLFLGFLIGGNAFVFGHFFAARYARLKKISDSTGQPIPFDSYLKVTSLTLGFNCLYNLAFLFLPATRNCAWMEIMNISYANGVKYHRWMGVLTVLTAALHCGGFFWKWLRAGVWRQKALPCFTCDITTLQGQQIWVNVFGELALLCFLLIGITSIPIVRRRMYNLFYYAHQLLFPAVVFAIMHWLPIVWWVLPTFLVYCYSRAVSSSNAWSPVEVQELTALSEDIVKLVLKRTPGRAGHFQVGQFLYLNVPSISRLQWHAFTIASSPLSSPTTITVLLKSLGDWTQALVEYTDECSRDNVLPTVYVDGFYGSSMEMYDEYSTVLLVGGGIGATPMFAILDDLVTKLSYEFQPLLRQRVVFIFSFRELALLEQVHPLLLRLKELDPEERYHKLHFYLTRPPSDWLLLQPVDYERLRGRGTNPTHYYSEGRFSRPPPPPFSGPLRSRSYKSLVTVFVFASAIITIVYMEFGDGVILPTRPELWPFVRFLEALVLVAAGFATWVFVLMERESRRRAALAASREFDYYVAMHSQPPSIPVSDVFTYGDLISHYKVTVGERPNMKALITRTFDLHTHNYVRSYGKPMIGVFVSGPTALKRACEVAAGELGNEHFDIHEEEFEL